MAAGLSSVVLLVCGISLSIAVQDLRVLMDSVHDITSKIEEQTDRIMTGVNTGDLGRESITG